MCSPILLISFFSLFISGQCSHHHHQNLTISSSLRSRYDDLIDVDLRMKDLEDHRKLGTVPSYGRWDDWYKNGYYWIRVYIDPSYRADSIRAIKKSFRSLQYRAKVVKFKFLKNAPQNPSKGNRPFLKVLNSDEGCWSWLGRNHDAYLGQEISLEEDWCTDSRTIQHEILHALGFEHEHNRPDRDDHIKIIFENVKPNYVDYFDAWGEINSLEVPYDLNSIMHYSEYDYSIEPRSLPTIKPLHGKSIGTFDQASWWDIVQLRLMYQCKESIGPRTQSQFINQPCSENCQCWQKRTGCKNKNSFCKGNLVCHQNTCKDPKDVPS